MGARGGGKREGRSNRGQLSEDFKTWSSSSLRTQVSTTSSFHVKDIREKIKGTKLYSRETDFKLVIGIASQLGTSLK